MFWHKLGEIVNVVEAIKLIV